MPRFSPSFRITFGLVSLTASILFIASAIGLIPDDQVEAIEKRKALSEEMAIHFSYCAQMGDISTFHATTKAVVERNPDILTAAVRRANGELLFEVGEHTAQWGDARRSQSTTTHLSVPITTNDQLWGTVELCFRPLGFSGFWAPFSDPVFPMVGFVSIVGMLAYYLYLRVAMRGYNMGVTTIPTRVRATLDTLVEGVVILDGEQRIAVANNAFAELIGESTSNLEGRKVSELAWKPADGSAQDQPYPWQRSGTEGTAEMGQVLTVKTGNNQQRMVSVNSAPIIGDDGTLRGVMATFDNLTVIEKKNAHLRKLLQKLKSSRAIIHEQNQSLRSLATRDPLTDCLNRRAFFEIFETQWSGADRYRTPLNCVMVDIDHFKSINDRHGHATGDLVLQHVARTLSSLLRKSDSICRYGGEEFCILLPQIDIEGALQAAERFRKAIEASRCSGITVTASLGISEISLGAIDPREMLNQADVALYEAKRQGRNRTIVWNKHLRHTSKSLVESRHAEPKDDQRTGLQIPFHAVTALVSALGYRHAETAEHSRRVADLCVAVAGGLMSQSECYVLEVAGLLHDIGKLGVPDAVLLKPGALDEHEWQVIRTHEVMGQSIITSAFSCDQLSEIICARHCWYGGAIGRQSILKGEDIPLGSRILSIADAFDAMVSDKVYRKGRPREAAFAELKRCAGVQFDPKLVELFIGVVTARNQNPVQQTIQVSKQTALMVGVQIEKLAQALDSGDHSSLALMASYLNATAHRHNIPPIAAAAARLEKSAAANDRAEITRTTIELLDLCRATYRSYIPSVSA